MRPRPALNSPCSLLSETAGLAVPDPFSPGFPNTPDEFSVEQWVTQEHTLPFSDA